MTPTGETPETKFRLRSRLHIGADLDLSPSQLAVTNLATNASVAVYGAPASGKTTALKALFETKLGLHRGDSVSDTQESHLSPGEILVVTANRESANSLRDELALGLQMATPGALARTLSSFAFGVLRHRAIAEGARLPELISGSEQDRILAGLIQRLVENGATNGGAFAGWPAHINEQVLQLTGFRIELRDLITICLEHDITPAGLRELGSKFQKAEWSAAADVYEDYLAVLSGPLNENRHDASGLLVAAAKWLTETQDWPAALADIKLVLVDDAQELTPAANRLLRAICTKGAGLVVFGDPDVSTLGFRAADPKAMSELTEAVANSAGRGASVASIFLEPTHAARSAEISEVVSKVSRLIDTAKAGRQRRATLVASPTPTESDGSVEGHVFRNATSENAWLARRLRELHLYAGIDWSEMAVVARSNQGLKQLELALSGEAVPVKILGAQTALRDEYASRALLRAVHFAVGLEPIGLTEALELLTSPLCGLDNLGLRRLRRALRREELLADGSRNSDELLVDLFSAEGSVASVSIAEGRRAARFVKSFFAVKVTADTASIEDLLWQFWNDSGLAKTWHQLSLGASEVAVQTNRNLDAVVGLFSAANRYVERNPAGSAAEFVAQQLKLGLPEDSLGLNDQNRPNVQLVTPAGLIGKRFKVVALPQLVEGVWPNLRPRSSLLGSTALDALIKRRIDNPQELNRSELPDELRMLHKAVGSASEKLLISVAEAEDTQASQFLNLMLSGIPPTREYAGYQLTLRGLAGQLRRRLATSQNLAERESVALALARLADAKVAGAHPDSWYGLEELSTDEPLFDLSAPAVTPDGEEIRVQIYPSQLENFVKCPLHWFLNSHGASDSTFSAHLGTLVHKALELGADIDEDALWRQVESKWHTLTFEAEWLEAAGERQAKKMISNMVQYLRKFQASGARVIGREANFDFDIGNARVRGQVDRIELHPDGRVVIVDLKTGKRQYSPAEVKENAQLGLYQLAFENGAFADVFEEAGVEAENMVLGGAKLLLVSGKNASEKDQESLATNPESRAYFETLIESATKGMAMTDRVFIARVDSHCTNENEYGSCQLHLTKAVSYVG